MTSIFKRQGRRGYAIKYRDPATRKERIRQFPTKGEAEMFSDRVRAANIASDGLAMDVRFDEYAEKWLKATSLAVRHGTLTIYTWAVTKYLIPAFRETYLRDINQKMVRELIVQLRTQLAKGTAGTALRVLHACLQAAVDDRILLSNPAAFRSRSKLMNLTMTAGEERGRIKAFDLEQMAAFFAAVKTAAPQHELLFRTMACTGLRLGETLALKIGDLNLDNATIRLERAITPRGRIEPCKTGAAGEFQVIDMPMGLATELRARVKDLPASEWLFPGGSRGRPYHHRHGVRDAFLAVLAAAKLPPHFTPHCLRHTYATQLLIAGESVYYVSRQLRHSDIRMTVRTYGSWLPAGDRAAADRVWARLVSVPKMLLTPQR